MAREKGVRHDVHFEDCVAGRCALPPGVALPLEPDRLAFADAGGNVHIQRLSAAQRKPPLAPPLGGIDEGYVDGVGTVRARLPRLSGPSIREQLRKKALGIGERISEATGAPEVKRRPAARAGACTRVVKPGTAFAALGIDVAAVEGGAFLLVTEKIVSSGDGRKFFRDRLVARVQIGVEFFGEDAIRLFDVRLGRVGGNA